MANEKSKPKAAVRLLRGWQGIEKGTITNRLTPGVMVTLVDNRIAEWFDDDDYSSKPERQLRRKRGTNSRAADAE